MMVGGAHVRSEWKTGTTLWQWRLLWNVESLLSPPRTQPNPMSAAGVVKDRCGNGGEARDTLPLPIKGKRL